jgi:membrane-bound ClpP family serine protease
MWWLIALLILVGALLLMVELVLLPGVTVAAILSACCYGGAAWLTYDKHGRWPLLWVVGVVIVVSVVVIWLSLRAKTWRRLALEDKIESRSQELPAQTVALGARGETLGRLAPMGTVVIDGVNYEAKTTGSFVDPKTEVEVIGFENFNVIVKPVK